MKKLIKKISRKNSFLKRMAWAGCAATAAMIFMFPPVLYASLLPPVEDVVSQLQGMYENTQDFTANFTQETTVTSVRKTDVEQGVVYYKNPRQMLWDYTRPKAKKLIINEKSAWLYLPDEKVAYTQDADQLFQSAALIKFLSGLGQLVDDFKITYASPAAQDPQGNYLLMLYPKEKGASYQYLRMTLDKDRYHILQVSFDDVLGNNTVLKFSRIRLNTKLSSNIFQFQPPADVSVFKMP